MEGFIWEIKFFLGQSSSSMILIESTSISTPHFLAWWNDKSDESQLIQFYSRQHYNTMNGAVLKQIPDVKTKASVLLYKRWV